MATVKYYWPEHKSEYIRVLEEIVERATKALKIQQDEEKKAEARLQAEVARTDSLKRYLDECIITLAAVRTFNPEDMYGG